MRGDERGGGGGGGGAAAAAAGDDDGQDAVEPRQRAAVAGGGLDAAPLRWPAGRRAPRSEAAVLGAGPQGARRGARCSVACSRACACSSGRVGRPGLGNVPRRAAPGPRAAPSGGAPREHASARDGPAGAAPRAGWRSGRCRWVPGRTVAGPGSPSSRLCHLWLQPGIPHPREGQAGNTNGAPTSASTFTWPPRPSASFACPLLLGGCACGGERDRLSQAVAKA
eukprot:scaffold2097_cov403-Prasinococcus_capsulatus_cf.AAC.17